MLLHEIPFAATHTSQRRNATLRYGRGRILIRLRPDTVHSLVNNIVHRSRTGIVVGRPLISYTFLLTIR
jgi:hypothetical protein